MAKTRVIEVNHGVFDMNDEIAEKVREMNKASKSFMVNIMASPGAGKTTLLTALIPRLKEKGIRIGVMEADIDATVDAEKMAELGVKTIQLHTGGECAMDAEMTLEALRNFGTEDIDLLFLENVGNLVCPAETDTGADLKLVLLSIPEGDDKPLKYPLMFEVADVVVVTKTDTAEYFSFDFEKFEKNVRLRNADCPIMKLSAKTGDGVDELAELLLGKI